MRPTGRLHLGHLEGVIRNWLVLQDQYPCYFFVADLHALTDNRDAQEMPEWTFEMVRDWLALGIDPGRATIFVQSHVPGVMFLATALGMTSPVSWLERCPTYKDRIQEKGRGSENLGLLSYPVLMAADVALYGADLVPVGEDQIPHLELAREVIRRFNSEWPGASLVEPQHLLTQSARLNGIDGRKMSKSYGNTLEISADPQEMHARIKVMKTDEARLRRQDPGNPDSCNLYPYHVLYSERKKDEIARDCRTAAIGCVDCKQVLMSSIDCALSEFRDRRESIGDEEVRRVIEAGAAKANAAAAAVVERVRNAMGLTAS